MERKEDLLSAVEEYLGDVNTWPTSILKILCVEDPTLESIRELASFMYGNKVPHRLATKCFQACNGGRLMDIACGMFECYCVWSRNPYINYIDKYWSMQIKAWVWINGHASNRGLERVTSSVDVTEFGSELSGCASMIQRAIDNVRKGGDNVK